ncbi:hypothetical protein QM012_005719 [Aureobasidium pullulans]|uniref:Uncharacterized protein n=1 Tax=Aureobasidium pullulans TaxID=5580 RepID=A0ABR0TS52_AURPU
MANLNLFSETPAEMCNKTFVEAMDHAKIIPEDALAKDLDVEVGTSKSVHVDHSTELHEAFESELHKVKHLEKLLADKDQLINKRLTYIRELEHRLSKLKYQNQLLRRRYENELTHSCYLSQTLSHAHEGVLSLQNQAAQSEILEVALREELQKRMTTIQDLEEQNRQLVAILMQDMPRVRESEHTASHQIPEKCAEDVSSQNPDSHEESPTEVSQVNPTLENTPAATTSTTSKPIRSILKRSSTDEPALTTLVTSATTWLYSHIKPADTREVYFHKAECDPKPSSPEFRERVRKQLNLEQLALARHYLISLEFADRIEESEQGSQNSRFEFMRREQEGEERQMFAQSPKQRLKMARMEQED